jgi:hypothetical protein
MTAAASVERTVSLLARLAGPQLGGDPRCPGIDGRPVTEVPGRQGLPRFNAGP